ncbi:VWA-like domain-containing protein [Halothiobacillus sp. DCM-1]|uniref:VWA-like domain-containing protein n=1 Tax=Halothiobacillus sp. DCM-1 TaxID=3112558 RepID=UPI00325298AB
MRWQATLAALQAEYPALMRALPRRVHWAAQGAGVGLSAEAVVLRRDWLDRVDTAQLRAAALHLAAHAALGHRPWRVGRAPVSAALDDAVQQLLRGLAVPEPLLSWRGDHHGTWPGVPVTEPGDAWMARPDALRRSAETARADGGDEANPGEIAPPRPTATEDLAAAPQSAGRGAGAGRGSAGRPPPTSPTDWRALLRLWLTRRAYLRWQFDRPSRRAVPPVLLPRLGGRQLALVLAVDVSGSIDPVWIAQFLMEAERLRGQFPMSLRLVTCDNRIHEDRPWNSMPRIDGFAGGGGTDFRPVFARVAEDAAVDALVYCTDLFGTWPVHPPRFPVFWLVPQQAGGGQRPMPPFGTVLWMNAA